MRMSASSSEVLVGPSSLTDAISSEPNGVSETRKNLSPAARS
ncbi:hypothetical protein [Methylobacter sp.]